MQDMYNAGYGDSITEIADAMALVKQNTNEVDPTKIKELAENAIILDETFSGMDMEETLRGADALMQNMGLSAEEAFDYIVVGAQNGLNKSNELTDNLAEYSQLWGQAGFSAEEMFSILDNGLSNGAYNLDKVNDFVKEFQISLSDGRIEENIGSFSVKSQELFTAWKNGEATTKEVFYSIINDLANMENQQEALTIASNTWSAVGEDNALKVITSMIGVNDTFKDVNGSMNDLKNIRTDSLQTQYKKLGRTLQTEILEPVAKKLLPVAKEGLEFIAENLDTIIPLATGVGTAMATIWVTKKASDLISKIKDTGTAIVGLITQTVAHTAATAAQTTATGAATVAQTGLNAAMKANPIGLVVTAIAGLVAGLMAFSALVGQDDASKLADEMSEAREEAEKARDEYSDLSTEYHNQSGEIMDLLRQLENLEQVEEKSAEQKEEMSRLVDELNKRVPELGLSYDSLNDSLNQTAESIDAVVRAAAGQEAYDSAVEARTAAAAEYNQAVIDQKKCQEELSAAQEENSAAIAENEGYYEMYGETVYGTQEKVDNLQKALDNANGTVEAASEKLQQATIDEQYYGLMVADLDSKTRDLVNTTLAQIDSLGYQSEAYNQSVEALSLLTETHTASMDAINAKIEENKQKEAELQQAYDEAYNSAYNSISGQLGLFNTMTVESTMSIDQMLGALDSQISYLDTFSSNMEKAIAMGVDEGLLAQLSDGSVESAAILQEIVNSGQDKITGPGGLNEKIAKVEEGKKKFSGNFAEMQTDFNEKSEEIQAEATRLAQNLNQSAAAYISGVNTIQGYIDGTEALEDILVGKYASLGEAVTAAYNGAVEINSPSKVFKRSGRDTVKGAIVGTDIEAPKLVKAYSDMGHDVIDSYNDAVESRQMAMVYDMFNDRNARIVRQYSGGHRTETAAKSNNDNSELLKAIKQIGNRPIYNSIYLDKKKVAEAIASDVTDVQTRDTRIKKMVGGVKT